MYLAKSAPLIVPAGAVILRGHHLHISGQECMVPLCKEKQENDETIRIEGDVIVSHLSHHYFHFMYDTVLRLWALKIHGILEKYANSTILWFGVNGPHPPTVVEMMKIILPEFPMNKSIFGRENTLYDVDHLSTMVMTRHNDYHTKDPWQDYNFWLIGSMRKTFKIVNDPKNELFISRRGNRRGIARENELYEALKSSLLPNLRLILPDDFPVATQTQMFANAKLVIAPHEASLTNALFSNWDKMILVELTKATRGGRFATYRNDLQVKQHYLLKCQSVQCSGDIEGKCDPWNTQIDVNVQNATEIIRNILSGNHSPQADFWVSANGQHVTEDVVIEDEAIDDASAGSNGDKTDVHWHTTSVEQFTTDPVQIQDANAASICAIQKHELWYIDEWVDYHVALGFQTIFIYDNSDDFELQDWYFKKLPNVTDRVRIVHWPGEVQQSHAYTKCIKDIQEHQTHSWIAFIDIDEFIVIKDTEKFPFIMDLLDSIPQDAGGLAVNWQVFDWNGHAEYEAKPLSLRFNHFRVDKHVKTIARTARIKSIRNPHWVKYVEPFRAVDTNGEIVEGPFNDRMPIDVLAVNHYHTKSLEEFKMRCTRGRADIKGMQNKTLYLPCKPDEDILTQWDIWEKNNNDAGHFDNSVWKLLKERVPRYREY